RIRRLLKLHAGRFALACRSRVEDGLNLCLSERAVVNGRFVNRAEKAVLEIVAARADGGVGRKFKLVAKRDRAALHSVQIEGHAGSGARERDMMKVRVGDGEVGEITRSE